MVEKSKINRAIINDLQVDDEGLKVVKTIDIKNLMDLGIKDVPAFLQGLLHSENGEDFMESSEDYVKGYRYGKTGTF